MILTPYVGVEPIEVSDMSEETLQDKKDQMFYASTKFWKQFHIHKKIVWPTWDVEAAVVLSAAAALILLMIPAKDISGMVQDLLPPMMGILATLIAFVFAGLVFFVSFHADDEYILCLGRKTPDTYHGFLFLFWWTATVGVAALIAGLFVFHVSYSPQLPGWFTGCLYLIVLLLFFYTILSVWNLFGTLARHGMYKLRAYIEWEKEEDEEDN